MPGPLLSPTIRRLARHKGTIANATFLAMAPTEGVPNLNLCHLHRAFQTLSASSGSVPSRRECKFHSARVPLKGLPHFTVSKPPRPPQCFAIAFSCSCGHGGPDTVRVNIVSWLRPFYLYPLSVAGGNGGDRRLPARASCLICLYRLMLSWLGRISTQRVE